MSFLLSQPLGSSDETHINYKNIKNTQNPFKSAFFEVFIYSYSTGRKGKKISFTKQIVFVVMNIIFCLQTISFLWSPELSIKHWNKTYWIWENLGYTRFDNFCATVDISITCLGFSGIFLLFCIAEVLALTILFYLKIAIPQRFAFIPRFTLSILCSIFQIPIVALFMITLKYNLFTYQNIKEYHDNNSTDKLKISSSFIIPIILLLAANFIIAICKIMFSGEIRHKYAEFNISARSHSEYQKLIIIQNYFLIFLYVTLQNDHFIYFQIIFLLVSFQFFLIIYRKAPYYSRFAKFVISCQYLSNCLVSSFFLLGYLIDDPHSIYLMSIILTPLGILLLGHFYINSRTKKQDLKWFLAKNRTLNPFDFEIHMRKFLLNPTDKNIDDIIKIFAISYLKTKIWKNKIFIIWEANFCFFTMEDPSLAKFKLSKALYADSSIEGDFRVHQCLIWFSENDKLNEEAKFLYYLNKLEQAKKEDEVLCMKLMQLWSEISSASPRLKKLNNQITKICKSLSIVQTLYTELVVKFNKSVEPYVLYGTFLQSIMLESDKSQQLLSKQESLTKQYFQSHLKEINQFNFYDEKNGILLVSCEKETLGEIRYVNVSAAQTLHTKIKDLVGSNFSSLFPSPFDVHIVRCLYKHAHLSTNSELQLPATLFIKNASGFLIEVNIKILLVAIDCWPFLLMIFKEKISKSHFAVISEKGIIHDYSMNFAEFVNHKGIYGTKINKILPNIDITKNPPFTPAFTKLHGENIAVIWGYKEITEFKMNYLVLINDDEEILQWMKSSEFYGRENHKKRFSLKQEFDEDASIAKVNFNEVIDYSPCLKYGDVSISYESNDTLLKSEEEDETTTITQVPVKRERERELSLYEKSLTGTVQSQSSLSLSRSAYGVQILFTLSKKIKIFNIFLILSILAIIITNSAVLIYSAQEVANANNFDALIYISKIQNSFCDLSAHARALYAAYFLGRNEAAMDFQITNIEENINILTDIHSNLLSNLTDWKTCSIYEIFTDNLVPVWTGENLDELQKINLIDTISQFIKHSESIISAWNDGIVLVSSIRFIALNGMSGPFHYCKSSISSLVSCEKNDIESLSDKIDTLLATGLIMFCICMLILIPFSYTVDTKLSNFWNHIKVATHESYSELKHACINRLSNIHGALEIIPHEHTSKLRAGPRDFRNLWRYIWRIAILFVLALGFYLIIRFAIYEKCSDYLTARPEFLMIFANRKIYITIMFFWQGEAWLKNSSSQDSLDLFLNNHYEFNQQFIEYLKVYKLVEISSKKLRDKKFSDFFSGEFTKKLFESHDSTDPYNNYGIYSAYWIALFDGFYFIGQDKSSLVTLKMMMDEHINLELGWEDTVDYANTKSKEMISDKLIEMIITTCLYFFVSISLYAMFYVPYLKSEQEKIKKMRMIASLIPLQSSMGRRSSITI
ncbi:unnamed protein product [Blepharisma stoltei]|uniref:TmcB/TmcC TPR repeats domain-containing protein n=1 Tax=Blepharisma stoltei TaxID=1481888 RepID=A0AAU9JRK1_9CILI|nr:unnamed protein product [Blepharisma stoltei]